MQLPTESTTVMRKRKRLSCCKSKTSITFLLLGIYYNISTCLEEEEWTTDLKNYIGHNLTGTLIFKVKLEKSAIKRIKTILF